MKQRIKQAWRSVRQQRKRWQLAAALRLLDRKPSAQPWAAAETKRIALFRWDDKLGDTLMAGVFVHAVKRARPDIHITFITGKQSAQLVDGFDLINEVLTIDKRSWRTAGRLKEIGGNFDLVIDPGTYMSAIDFYALRNLYALHYMGYNKHDLALFDVAIPSGATHFCDRYLAAATLITGTPATPRYYLPSSSAAREQARRFYATFAPPKQVLLLNLFASSKHRTFSMVQAREWVQWLLNHDEKLVVALLCVPGQDEFLETLCAQFDPARVRATPTPASIPLTIELAKHASIVMSPDTAMAHFASVLEKPSIAIFQDDPVNLAEWRPQSNNAQIVLTRAPRNSYDRVNIAEFEQMDLAAALDRCIAAAGAPGAAEDDHGSLP